MTVTYNTNEYTFVHSADPSSGGSIYEIITCDEYDLKRFVGLDTTIIDIGANHGVATVILAKQNPKSTIYSFEPDPAIFEKLVANIAANKLTNVIAKCMAVSDDSSKTLQLMMHPQWSGGNTTCSDSSAFNRYFGIARSVTVPCISFDDIIMQNNIKNIALLKIDCEGAEYEIIYSSEQFKTGIVENIVGEFHNLQYNSKVSNTSDELEAYVKQYVTGLIKISSLTL
jgi:FkbM family methyltransferase